MAKLEEKTLQSRPKIHGFLCCFGFARKIHSRKSLESMKSDQWRRRSSSFSLSRLNGKKSGKGKTMPVDVTVIVQEKEDDSFPATPKKSTPPSGDKLRPPAASDQTLDEKDNDTNWSEQSPKNSHSPILKSVGRRMEPIGAKVACQSSSRVEIAKRNLTKRSISLPPWEPKPSSKPTADDPSRKKPIDPIAGMFILMVALLIMLLWGKLCAIICTSAWFYILPRLSSSWESKNKTEERSRNLKITEINSDLYMKNKVVFEGFLERTHRSQRHD